MQKCTSRTSGTRSYGVPFNGRTDDEEQIHKHASLPAANMPGITPAIAEVFVVIQVRCLVATIPAIALVDFVYAFIIVLEFI